MSNPLGTSVSIISEMISASSVSSTSSKTQLSLFSFTKSAVVSSILLAVALTRFTLASFELGPFWYNLYRSRFLLILSDISAWISFILEHMIPFPDDIFGAVVGISGAKKAPIARETIGII